MIKWYFKKVSKVWSLEKNTVFCRCEHFSAKYFLNLNIQRFHQYLSQGLCYMVSNFSKVMEFVLVHKSIKTEREQLNWKKNLTLSHKMLHKLLFENMNVLLVHVLTQCNGMEPSSLAIYILSNSLFIYEIWVCD